jgi:ATP synthase F1 delta subunit
MKKNKYIKRYARTLIEASTLEGAPKVISELNALRELMSKSRELKMALEAPQFSNEEKSSVIKELGSRLNLSETSVKFINYISGERAMPFLGAILDAANSIYLEKKRISKAIVMTPSPIGKEYETRLRESLRKVIGRDVELQYVTEPSLIGGMLIKVGSTMYDGSVKGQLRLLKDELIKG